MSSGPVLHFPWPKPEFGNIEHIRALQDYQRQIIAAEVENEENGDRREFLVEVEWSGSTTVRVLAHNAAEAKELAHDEVDFSADIDDVNYSAREAAPPSVEKRELDTDCSRMRIG